MAGLQSYTQKVGNVGQVPNTPSIAAQETGKQLNSLSQKLSSFSQFMYGKESEVQANKAKEDALRDSADGKPFYKKSVYTAYGKAYNNTYSATYASSAEIAMNKKSFELAMQFQNDPQAYNDAMKSYVDTLSKKAPTAELNTVIGITGEKVKNATFGKLAISENARVKSSQYETFKEDLGINIGQIIDLEHAGRQADADILKAKNIEHLGALINEGVVDPATAQQIVDDAEFSVTTGVVQKKMESLLMLPDLSKAKELLEQETSEHRKDMDLVQNQKHQNALVRLFNNEVKARKAAEKGLKDNSNQIIRDEIDVLKVGKESNTPPSKVKAALASASEATKWEYEKQQQVTNIINSFGFMSLPEMEDKLNEFKAKKEASAVDVDVMHRLEQRLHQRATQAKDDVVGIAIREGVIPQTPKMGADAGIDGLLNGIATMQALSPKIQTEYGDDKTDLLSKQDAQSWADYLSSNSVDVQSKIDLIKEVATKFPSNTSKKVFSQIGGKNAGTFLFAADLATHGNERAARTALLGKGADVELDEGLKQSLKTKLGNAFGGYGSELFNRQYRGLIDYAKGLSLEDSVFSADYVIEKSIGTIEKYNNKNTIIPYGVTKRQFEHWLDNIVIPGRPKVQAGLRDMTDMLMNGDYQLHYAGQGEYYIKDNNDGNPYFINDSEDPTKPMILKWGK